MKKLILGIVFLLAGVGGAGYCIYLLNSGNFNQEKKNEQISEDSSSQSLQCQRSLEKLKNLNSLQQKNNQKLLKEIEQLKKEKVAVATSDSQQKNENT
ncbi:MAG: hypothetical protein PF689_02660, partial [Deltaproteobacteria bacterium]|nr:hypothetical protein [Deltaproteobacteria bacterium]